MKPSELRKLSASPVDLLTRMVEIASPSRDEEELAIYLAHVMSTMGYTVKRDSAGNVIGEIGHGSPRVLLCGHMDTVPTMIPVKVEEGVLHGRGSVDAKAPLAAIIVAASRAAKYFNGTLVVACVTDEEGRNQGIRNIVKNYSDFDCAVFGEPTNVDTITVGYKGNLSIKVICETVTGHSSAPWLFENSAEKAIEIWSEIKTLSTLPVNGSYFNSVSVCLKRIQGGQESSIVPSSGEILIDIRFPPGVTAQSLEDKITRILQRYTDSHPKVRVSYERIDYAEPYLSPNRTLAVKALSSAIYRLRGTHVRLITRTGTGDMNVFGNATGVPSVTYGPGDSHYDHTPNEQIKLNDYLESVEILTKAILLIGEYYEKRSKTP
jgi:LysW-gamma-L-lysine carboxypeptidase